MTSEALAAAPFTTEPATAQPATAQPATAQPTTAPAEVPATTGNTYSVIGLVLSILSIPMSMGVLAIVGVILGFIGRSTEPAARLVANWAIVVGFVALFGGIALAIAGFVIFAPFALAAGAFGGFWILG